MSQYAQEARATVLSGVAESTSALIVLGYWYMYAMTAWVDRGVENATTGKLGAITDQAIASVALSVWLTHPLTWLLGYFLIGGLCGFMARPFQKAYLARFRFFFWTRSSSTRFAPPLTIGRRGRPQQ